MRHDDIITKMVGPRYHLVWPPFLKTSCFLNTSCFPFQKGFPFSLLICKGSRALCQEPLPSAAIPTPLWCRSEEAFVSPRPPRQRWAAHSENPTYSTKIY